MAAGDSGREAVPMYFGEEERRLFGWFHPPSGEARRCGVVLVSPLGVDHTRSHRVYRHLAERLARAGCATLRFDLHGTGDSADGKADEGSHGRWLADIDAAVEQLRLRARLDSVSLVGLRIAATLAMTAAARREDVRRVVLWGPCATGASYVKELVRMHRMYAILEPQRFQPGPPRPGGKEALGFFMPDALVAELERLDLSKVSGKVADQALVIGTENTPQEDALVAALKARGTDTTYRHMPGHKFLVKTPREALLPEEILEAITSFMVTGNDVTTKVPAEPPAEATRVTLRSADGAPEVTEQMLRFGDGRRLFGILTRPPEGRRAALPAILVFNAGCIHRPGAQRNHVTLARRWARLGFPVLRFDLGGIGDSRAASGANENEVFPESAPRDIDDAMSAMKSAMGPATSEGRFIVVGLCSGGDYAFKTALDDRRVVGAVLMNPRTFLVNSNEIVEAYANARYYQASVLKKEKWAKLLRGQVDVARIAKRVIPKARDLVKKRLDRALTGALRRGEPAAEDVPGCLRSMVTRGVDTLLVVSTHDPGIEYVDAHFTNEMRALAALPGFRREDIPGADHSFTAVWSQERVHDLVTGHLVKTFARAPTS